MSLHRSADYHVNNLKQWARNIDQINQSGERQPGVNENLLLFYLNEGKDNLQRAVANARQGMFLAFVTKPITSRVLEFDIPEEALSGNRVIRLDYAATNENSKFYQLDSSNINSWDYAEGDPEKYYLVGSKVVVFPIPSSGYYRFCIQRRDDELDVRRAQIASSGEVVAGDSLTEILLEDDIDSVNSSALKMAEYVCVSGYDGTVKGYNIPVLRYEEDVPRIVVRQPFPWTAATIAEGDYITIGKNSTTHSKLAKEFEQYYVEWAKMRLRGWDASDQEFDGVSTLQTLRAEIIDSYSDIAGVEFIPQVGELNGSWFG